MDFLMAFSPGLFMLAIILPIAVMVYKYNVKRTEVDLMREKNIRDEMSRTFASLYPEKIPYKSLKQKLREKGIV